MVSESVKSWYTYIVRCSDGTLYTGITMDIQSRVAAHNHGTGARYTRSRRPVHLVYREEFPARSDAARRECELKKLKRTEKEQLINESKLRM